MVGKTDQFGPRLLYSEAHDIKTIPLNDPLRA